MSIQQWSIGKKLWFLSGVLLANIVFQGFLGYYYSHLLIKVSEELAFERLPAVRLMTLADMMHDGVRAVTFRSILVSKLDHKDRFDEVSKESEEMYKNFRDYLSSLGKLPLTSDNRDTLSKVMPVTDRYSAESKEIVRLALAGKIGEAESLLPNFEKTFEELESSLAKLGDAIEEEANVTQGKAKEVGNRASAVQTFMILMGVVLGFLNALWIIRSLLKTVEEVMKNLATEAENVKHTSKDLETSSTSLSNATTQQAAAIQETAASIEEMDAMVKKSAENATKSREVSSASQSVANRGKKTVDEMLDSINEINVSNEKIMKAIDHSNRQISEIVGVITEIGNKTKVINDIVFQTKLLSFNASVEAARAGEHGKGFAVVAEEVGNLAQMSGNAAKEISDMLTGSIQKVEKIVGETKMQVERLVAEGKSKVESGTIVAKQCSEILDEMVRNVSDVNGMISEISTAVHEQSLGVTEITKAMNQLDQTTHENASVSQHSAASAAQMATQSERLIGVVGMLKRLVDGVSTGRELSYESSRDLKSVPVQWKSFAEEKTETKEIVSHQPRSRKLKAVGGSDTPSENDPRFQDL